MEKEFLNKIYLTESDKMICQKYSITEYDEQVAVHNLFSGDICVVKESMSKLYNMLLENYTFSMNEGIYTVYQFNTESGLFDTVGKVKIEEAFNTSVITLKDEESIAKYNRDVLSVTATNLKDKLENADCHLNIEMHHSHAEAVVECLPILCKNTDANDIKCTKDKIDSPLATIKFTAGDIPEEVLARINAKLQSYKDAQIESSKASVISNAFYKFMNELKSVSSDEITKIFALENDDIICLIQDLKERFE